MNSLEELHEEAPQAQSNEDLVRRFVESCRRTRTILPATTTIERLCADALVDAERRIEARIAERVPPGLRRDLEHLLEETVDAGVTRFVWLRQFEPGSNSADVNRLLDRLEHLRRPRFRKASSMTSRRIASRGYAGRESATSPTGCAISRTTAASRSSRSAPSSGRRSSPRRWWRPTTGSSAERIAKPRRICESQIGDETPAVREALRAFAELGTALIGARETGEALDSVTADRPGWEGLGDLVARAAALANTAASDPLDHILGGYSRFRRYTPRLLRMLDIEASPVAGDPVVLPFAGPVPQLAALVEVDGALEGVVRLALVQSDLDPPSHPRVEALVPQALLNQPSRRSVEAKRLLAGCDILRRGGPAGCEVRGLGTEDSHRSCDQQDRQTPSLAGTSSRPAPPCNEHHASS